MFRSELERARSEWLECECPECMRAKNAERKQCPLYLKMKATETKGPTTP